MTFDELPKNIRDNIRIENNHWIWNGAIRDKSRNHKQGVIRFNGKTLLIHRVIYHLFTGFDLESEFQINHNIECNISLCCNPEHLNWGIQQSNMIDKVLAGIHHELQKTHCSKGHEYNVSPTTGDKYCQICKNERRNEWRKRNKGEKNDSTRVS